MKRNPQHSQQSSSAVNELFTQARQRQNVGRRQEAERIYKQILALNPDIPEVHYNFGLCLHDMGRHDEAAQHYERALALRPNLAPAHNNLGNIRKGQNRLDDAAAHFRQAIGLNAAYAEPHYNLAGLLKDNGAPDEAIMHYKRALEIKPDYADAHNNLGLLLKDAGKFDEAFTHFRRAHALAPDHAESRVNEAMTLLLTGDMEAGWRAYEWRWRMKGVKPLATDKPFWDGGDLNGKTILLHSEQGLGDSLQFIRYAAMVKARGGKIIVSCPRALVRLFQNMDAIDRVFPIGDALPHYDCHAPLMSLPFLFGTTLATVPDNIPYLAPPVDVLAQWIDRMKPHQGKKKIGLVWAGSPREGQLNAHIVDRRRSMKLNQFAPLASIPGLQFFSLQKGVPAEQAKNPPPGLILIDYMNDVNDFADTAAFVAQLDLVIGVDTSVVHLAGALGKPVWVLSRFDGCWRWLQNRETNPWYPSARIFGQPKPGNWDSVVERVKTELERKAK